MAQFQGHHETTYWRSIVTTAEVVEAATAMPRCAVGFVDAAAGRCTLQASSQRPSFPTAMQLHGAAGAL